MAGRSLDGFTEEACLLASMLEGIGLLHEVAEGPGDCPRARRARGAVGLFLEAVTAKAWALNDELERAELVAALDRTGETAPEK